MCAAPTKIEERSPDVRFTPKSGHGLSMPGCPLCANSGSRPERRIGPISAVAPMKVAQVPKPGGEFQIVDREMPEPDTGHVGAILSSGGPTDAIQVCQYRRSQYFLS